MPLHLAEQLLAGSDPVDLDAWESLMAEDVHLRVANRSPAVGLAKAMRELAALFAHVEALGRGFRELWPSADGRTLLMELDLLPVGDPAIPIGIVLRTAQPLVLARDIRFYLDPAPLNL